MEGHRSPVAVGGRLTALQALASRAGERSHAQGLVEYGLIIALVAVLAIAGLVIFGPAISSLLANLGGSV